MLLISLCPTHITWIHIISFLIKIGFEIVVNVYREHGLKQDLENMMAIFKFTFHNLYLFCLGSGTLEQFSLWGRDYTAFKSLFSPFRGFFTLLLRPCVPYALTYAPVWIATRSSDWSTCTLVILLLCSGVNGLREDETEMQNGEKINIQTH